MQGIAEDLPKDGGSVDSTVVEALFTSVKPAAGINGGSASEVDETSDKESVPLREGRIFSSRHSSGTAQRCCGKVSGLAQLLFSTNPFLNSFEVGSIILAPIPGGTESDKILMMRHDENKVMAIDTTSLTKEGQALYIAMQPGTETNLAVGDMHITVTSTAEGGLRINQLDMTGRSAPDISALIQMQHGQERTILAGTGSLTIPGSPFHVRAAGGVLFEIHHRLFQSSVAAVPQKLCVRGTHI